MPAKKDRFSNAGSVTGHRSGKAICAEGPVSLSAETLAAQPIPAQQKTEPFGNGPVHLLTLLFFARLCSTGVSNQPVLCRLPIEKTASEAGLRFAFAGLRRSGPFVRRHGGSLLLHGSTTTVGGATPRYRLAAGRSRFAAGGSRLAADRRSRAAATHFHGPAAADFHRAAATHLLRPAAAIVIVVVITATVLPKGIGADARQCNGEHTHRCPRKKLSHVHPPKKSQDSTVVVQDTRRFNARINVESGVLCPQSQVFRKDEINGGSV